MIGWLKVAVLGSIMEKPYHEAGGEAEKRCRNHNLRDELYCIGGDHARCLMSQPIERPINEIDMSTAKPICHKRLVDTIPIESVYSVT